jgi:predicted nucleic acid-binding protein
VKISHALRAVKRIYVETSPLIYYVEENPTYVDRMEAIIGYIEDTPIEAVSSVITLLEVLKQPIQLARNDLETAYRDILLADEHFRVLPVLTNIAESAAHLRAKYNLRTPDAIHVATAIEAKVDAFLTNDIGIKRVKELPVLILDDLELDQGAK